MSVEVRAQNTLSMTSVKAIKDATDQSAQLLATMEQYAEDAGTTLTGIYQDAMDAQTSADKAQASADSASEYASRAYANLSTVQNITETLNWITAHGTMTLTTDIALDPTHIYFVVDQNGDYVVNGTHYAVVTEPDVADISTYYELSIDQSLNNYVATHLAVDSEGLWIIPEANGNKVLIATGNGSTYTTAGTYIIGKANNVDTIFAKFLSNGATIMAEGGVQVAQLGYGQGYDDQGQLVDAPFYTLGTRQNAFPVGNYSVASGFQNIASDFASQALGLDCEAGGFASIALGDGAHAFSNYSVAIGFGTIAQRRWQTAIGKYNLRDETGQDINSVGKYAFVVGNGTGWNDNLRHNAFAVTWQGDVEIDLPDYQTASTTDKAIYDALVALGWDSDVLS